MNELPRLPSEAYIKGREDASKKLRDEFAGLAMQAMITRGRNVSMRTVAEDSYKMADEMMREKEDE